MLYARFPSGRVYHLVGRKHGTDITFCGCLTGTTAFGRLTIRNLGIQVTHKKPKLPLCINCKWVQLTRMWDRKEKEHAKQTQDEATAEATARQGCQREAQEA